MSLFRGKISKALLALLSALLLVGILFVDIVRKSVDVENQVFLLLRSIAILGVFGMFYLLLESLWKKEQTLPKKLGFALVLSLSVSLAAGVMLVLATSPFDSKGDALLPRDYSSVINANVLGIMFGVFSLIILLTLRDVILSRRKKGTVRNFGIVLGLILAAIVSTLPLKPLEASTITMMLFGLAVAFMALNAFRLSWIVYLTKREKWFCVWYGLLLFIVMIFFSINILANVPLGNALRYYSRQLHAFAGLVSIFGAIYFGMTFLGTLFHLPTAEAFERKTTEVASLHTLGRLITQVFDFNELVNSVTKMTLEVCKAQSSWLEIIQKGNDRRAIVPNEAGASLESMVTLVGLQNITKEETDVIISGEARELRLLLLEEKRPIVIEDVNADRRTQHLAGEKHRVQSLVIVPLMSHSTVIGILYATKELAYGFEREDVDLISAFADQAAIAIENSRLIEKSLERERLMREMMVAQDMQRRLLPQSQPLLPQIEFEALSTPAFEVGGDYYDYAILDQDHIGIIVGDVSGKGVSASFYMAEMKGIFQSLSKIYHSPRELLTHAHAALAETIDRRSFVSVIYAVLNLQSGMMTLSRAGHCPLLLVTDGNASYLQPRGMGLGMGSPSFFTSTLTEQTVMLRKDDVAIFFTDGVTEARPPEGEEFGYERLLQAGRTSRRKSALEIRDDIILAVDRHLHHQPPEDDLTLVVVKWLQK